MIVCVGITIAMAMLLRDFEPCILYPQAYVGWLVIICF
jgi:hypothetical protein